MDKRIQLERRGKEPSKVTELNLDNCRATQIEGLTDEYTGLEMLSMINVGLTSLKGFPKLPELKKLELSDNRISSGLSVLKECPKLSHLNLSNNRIKDLESLEPLQSLKCLTNLDLFNNDVCNIEDYRNKIFTLLPDLKFLDDAGQDGNEVEESDAEDGQNGTADDDEGGEEEEDVDDEEDGSEEEDDGPGLAALYGNDLDDDEDGDFDETAEEEEEDLDDEEEDDESHEPTGSKRRRVEEPTAEEDAA